MTFEQVLSGKRHDILRKWLRLVFATYPPNTEIFLRNERDRFANPVGYTITCNLEEMLDGLIENIDIRELSSCVEEVVKIRAVQDFSPSQALSFVWLLKRATSEILDQEIFTPEINIGWRAFDSKIDQMAALAFDLYSDCKDKIGELKLRELRSENDTLMKMMGKTG